MDTSPKDYALVGHPFVLRVLVVAGALFGFTLLALAVSGAADASEASPPPERSGVLDRVGNAAHDVLKPVEPVLEPVVGTVHAVSSQVAPAVKPVTSGLLPVVAPLVRPVLERAEPVVSALRPVTRPVLHALSPVTSPVLGATAPLTAPVVRAIGVGDVVPAVTGHPVPGGQAKPTSRGELSSPPVVAEPVGWIASVEDRQGDVQRRHDGQPGSRQVAGHVDSDPAGVAGPIPASGGGGRPADVSGMSGAMSAGTGSQYGGEYAVTSAGAGAPRTDRSWRAPPAGSWSLHWLEYYGNDHPS